MKPFRNIPPTTRLLVIGLACLCFATVTTVFLSTGLLRKAAEREAMVRVGSNMSVAEKLLGDLGPVTILSNGKMFAGNVDLRDNALVDGIQALVGGVATVFQGATRLSTNVLLRDGTRGVGTQLADADMRDALLVHHRPYRGVADVLGKRYYSAYDPILDADGVAVGILYVGLEDSVVLDAIGRTRDIILGVSSGITLAIAVLLSWLGGKLAAQIAARQRQLEQAHSHLDTALANMANGLSLWDANNNLVLANKRLGEVLDLSPASIYPGMSFRAFIRARCANDGLESADADVMYDTRLNRLKTGQFISYTYTSLAGRTIHVQAAHVADGGWLSTYEDVTERTRAEAKIAYMAEHDGLTGLANRSLFQRRLRDLVNEGASFALLLLDLDLFKKVNDKLGHPAGDSLLKAAALRLQSAVRDGDLVARLGGDEFAVVQVGGTWPDDAATLASRIIETLCQPFQIDGNDVCVGASCGLAFPDPAAPDTELLLKQADVALYAAKSAGRSTHRCFNISMEAELRERELFEEDLRQALANNEFKVFYQPLVDVRRSSVSGFEALLRWQHPTRGTVPPSEFIPVVESTGMIGTVGAWVLQRACLDAAAWPGPIRVAVNLSALQFHDGDLVGCVRNALRQSGLRPDRLELEITESVLLQGTAAVSHILYTLRDLGVRIAMDDFGTGYSSLSYLQSFPFDKIKIDQTFIRGLNDTAGSGAIVRAVTALAGSLGMETVAEGVETTNQCDRVCAEGCSEVQGYLFSKPRPVSDVPAMLIAVDDYFQRRTGQHRDELEIVQAM